jgi:hypothetical protein
MNAIVLHLYRHKILSEIIFDLLLYSCDIYCNIITGDIFSPNLRLALYCHNNTKVVQNT